MCMCIWWEEEIEIIVGHDFLACVAGFSNGNVGLVADLDNNYRHRYSYPPHFLGLPLHN